MTKRITTCEDCKYHAMTYDIDKCSKCGGKLEILASTDESEVRT